MPAVLVRGIRIYAEMRGDGPRLLYLPGTGADLRLPRNPLERELERRCQVLCLDHRGTGRSDKPDVEVTVADFADDAAALMDAAEWERCAVIGYSFGGMVAQELALRHPGRVERLVLVSTTSGGVGGSSFPVHELDLLDEQARATRYIELSDLRRTAAWRAANPGPTRALINDIQARWRLGRSEPGHEAGRRRQLRARAWHDTWERLPEIVAPAAVFGGRFDGIAPQAYQHRMASHIPGARFEIHEGGHQFFAPNSLGLVRVMGALSA